VKSPSKHMKSKQKPSPIQELDESDIFNRNTRYCRARVLIKWKNTFQWDEDEATFISTLKSVIVNKKLLSIPDRAKLNSRLDSVVDQYVKYQQIPNTEQEKASSGEIHQDENEERDNV